MSWYYAEDGAQKGPITEEQFQALVQAGTITPETLIWRDGMSDWRTYQEVFAPPAVPTQLFDSSTGSIVEDAAMAEPMEEAFDADVFLENLRNNGYSIDIGGAISRGWDVVVKNFWPAVGVNLLIMLLKFVVSFIPFLGNFAQVFLTGPFAGGLYNYFLLQVRNQTATIEDAFAGFVQPRFLKLMLTGFMIVVIQIVVALVLLTPLFVMVPGLLAYDMDPEKIGALSPLMILWGVVALIPVFFLSVIWYPTYIIIVDTGLSFWEAMEFSRKIVMMRFWSWLFFIIVCAVLVIAGFMAFCLGALVAIPVTIAAFATVWNEVVVAARKQG
jgi:hypothetical protein